MDRHDSSSSATLKTGQDVPSDTVIAVVGLGYVGLPLAVEFGKRFPTIGFDLSERKVAAYKTFVDPTGEVSTEELRAATKLSVTTDPSRLREADFVIVAVPTPIDDAHQPDFGPLLGASETVGRNLKRGATIVFESTVYPGATEEVCVPVIEKHSGMQWRRDFFVGYSPERINPGDREHSLTRITKVVSGDTAGDARARRRRLRLRRHRRGAPRQQHQGRRGGQGHREHAARSQHRPDERAVADLPQARASTRWRSSTRPGPSGTSCRFGPDWSAATASASIRITSRTRPTSSATTRR